MSQSVPGSLSTPENTTTLNIVPDTPQDDEHLNQLFQAGLNGQAAGELPTNIDVDVSTDQGAGNPYAASPSPDGSDDDVGILGTIWDGIKGIGNGIGNAAGETIDFAEELITGKDNDRLHNLFGDQKTAVGEFTNDIAAFVAGFWTGGKILKGMKLLQGAGKAAAFARGTAQGAFSDFFTEDGQAENLSALIQKNDTLKNIITETFATSKDSNEFTGRLKHAFEGMALGALTEPLAIILGTVSKRIYRAFRKGDAAVLENGVEEGALKITSEDMREAYEQLEKLPQETKAAFMDSLDQSDGLMDSAGKNIAGEPKNAAPFAVDPDNAFLARNADDGTDPAMRGIPKRLAPNVEGYEPPTVMLHEEKGLDTLRKITETINKAPDRESAIRALQEDVTLSDKILNDPDALRLLEKTHRDLEAKTIKARGPETLEMLKEETDRMASEYGMLPMQDLFKKAVSGDIPLKDVRYAARFIQMSTDFVASALARIARQYKLNGGEMLLQDWARVDVLKTNLDNLYLAQRNLKTLSGRNLNAFKWLASVDSAGNVRTAEWVTLPVGRHKEDIATDLAARGWTTKKRERLMADILANANNPAKIAKLTNRFDTASKLGILNEFRINNMLSGPFTIGANVIGNALKAAVMPAERYLAGAISGNAAMRQEAFDMFSGLVQYTGEAWRLGKKAAKIGNNILDNASGKLEANATAQMTYENVRKLFLKGQERELTDVEEMLARGMGWFGPYARIPSRLMVGTDEFFKQLNFRASYSARLKRLAGERGIVDPAEIDAYVRKEMDRAFDPKTEGKLMGDVLSDDLLQEHIQYARESTWTQSLGHDTMGGWMQQGVNQHPMLRIVVPFVKTPVNLFRDFTDHTPLLCLTSRRTREALAAGGEQAAMAKARVAVGSLTMITVGTLAGAGCVTGSPPVDEKQRKALEATGWQPYSIRVGDHYFSYRRLDPVGMFFGIMADLNVARQYVAQASYEKALKAVMAAFVNNITSKTYMQGVSEFIDLMNDPDRTAIQYLGRFGSTFVPFASAARFMRQQMDDPMREARSITDYLMNTVPGFSQALPARRSWVTGDVVTYDLFPRNKKDMVLDELNNMAESIQGPPAKRLKGIELSSAQLSRLQELHGTIRVGGKTMYETLEELFNSSDYDLHRRLLADPPDKENGPRSLAIRRIINTYRQAAQDALIDEDAELEALIRQSDFQRVASRRGKMTTLNQQELLDALKDY